MLNKQMKAPIFDALKNFISDNTIPFLQGTEDHSLETIKVLAIHLAWVNNEEIADVG
jgi:hypothetical protein